MSRLDQGLTRSNLRSYVEMSGEKSPISEARGNLMAEVLEDHIRLHLLTPERSTANPDELVEDMIELVRAYLK